MKRLFLVLTAGCFLSLTACNNNPAKSDASTTTDTMQMDMHHQDSAVDQAAMPAVPEGAKVFFKNLKDGQTVSSPFTVEMGVEGMTVEPAGTVNEGFGHHHILVDAGDSMATGTVIPADSTHLHFGKGQTETQLTLTPGAHTLTLQFADGAHRSYGQKMAATIKVNVK